jgi:hypothetical protein
VPIRPGGLAGLGALALAVLPATAAADPTPPILAALPAFAAGTQLSVGWTPATFTAGSVDRTYQVTAHDLSVTGADVTASAADPATSLTLAPLQDGHQYSVTVRGLERPCLVPLPGGCQVAAGEPVAGPPGEARTTRIDATPPTGTLAVDGGATFTDSRSVVLSISATDPPSAGFPPSGLAGLQVGDEGTFACAPGDVSAGCLLPFAGTVTHTLPAGPDGLRMVSIVVRDAAGPTAPGASGGNASPTISDAIRLDTLRPTARVVASAQRIAPGGRVVLDGSASVDGTGSPDDSGVDPRGVEWQFGDGTTGRGERVRHAYAGPGLYVGRLLVRDRAGNVATRAFRVRVARGPAVSATTTSEARLLAPEHPTALASRRALRVRWRRDPRARYYNVQLFRQREVAGERKLASVFPSAPRAVLPGARLTPGRYLLYVWSGLGPKAAGKYASRPWLVTALRVR